MAVENECGYRPYRRPQVPEPKSCLHRSLAAALQCLPASILTASLFSMSPARASGLGDETVDKLDIDITHTSLQELLKLDVTTVFKRPGKLSRSPAAVFVLTNDDIRRSGARTIPDALRLVPGVHVVQYDNNNWSVDIRGFGGASGEKQQVLIDGRSVYDQLFTSVFWESQDVMLEDIDRIEVVRGPGGTLWGANAVNGVINIITKSARDTQGSLVAVGAGTTEREFGHARYGWKVGDDAYLRVYGKAFSRGAGYVSGAQALDNSDTGHGGFRADWGEGKKDAFTFQGDATILNERLNDFPGSLDAQEYTGNLLGRWSHQISSDSDLMVQTYADRLVLKDVTNGESTKRNNWDITAQQTYRGFEGHDLIWGGGYRYSRDRFISPPTEGTLNPGGRTLNLFNLFIQDTAQILPDRLAVTYGTKFEHNDFTGAEWQPNVRLAYTPDDRQTFWAAVSRAIREPSRVESDVFIPGMPSFHGNRDIAPEKLIAYELGYRVQPRSDLNLDAAVFWNTYEDLVTFEPTTFRNLMHGDGYGVELAARWQPVKWFHLDAAYTFLDLELQVDSNSIAGPDAKLIEGSDASNRFSIRSAVDLPHNVELDVIFRYSDALPALNVPDYFVSDVRIAWRPMKHLSLNLIGRNLFDSHHVEQPGPGPHGELANEIQSSILGEAVWTY